MYNEERSPLELRYDILRGLVLKYQQTHDPVVFEKILKRVDGLIIRTVSNVKRRESYLRGVELQELYQIGVMGVYDAVTTSPANEAADKFPARIVAYIRSNILRVYIHRCKITTRLITNGDFVYNDTTYAEFVDLLDVLEQMYINRQLSKEDMELLRDKYFREQILRVLGPSRGISYEWVRQKLIKIIQKIRRYSKSEHN